MHARSKSKILVFHVFLWNLGIFVRGRVNLWDLVSATDLERRIGDGVDCEKKGGGVEIL